MLGKLAELFIFGLAPFMLGGLAMPGAFAAEEITISGEVFYRERIALPPNAVLSVRLSDVSLADAPAATIAEQTIDPAGQVPIAFEIRFDSSVIQPKAAYALQARITVDNELWFINDERHDVDPSNPGPQKLLLTKVSQGAAEAPSLIGPVWLAEDIAGQGVIDNAQSTFQVSVDGKVSGSGACNHFAQAEVDGDRISIGKAGATMMACAPALMDQERKFFDALEKAASFRFDREGRLYLVDSNGIDIVRFAEAS